MISSSTDLIAEELERVREWPDELRRRLASRLLQSVSSPKTPMSHESSPAQLIGAWSVEAPPSDIEVEQILKEECLRKYG